MDSVMITEITGQDFDEQVLKSELPVFACFVAQWCHSCYPTCFITDELAKQYEGQIRFVKIDAEKSPEIQARYHIIALPCIIIFQNSQLVKKLLGYQGKSALRDMLDALSAGVEAPLNISEEDDEEA